MKTFSFLSGKGGTGKTLLAINFAISLAEEEMSVLLFDGDFGLANADILMGCEVPVSLAHVIKEKRPLADAVASTDHGVDLISGGSGMEELTDLPADERDRILKELANLISKYDYVVLDGPSGLDSDILPLTKISDLAILVSTPEPTSLMDNYATAKYLWSKIPNHKVGLVINMASSAKGGISVWNRLAGIIGRFLSKEVMNLGYVRRDRHCETSVLQRIPLLIGSPNCTAAQDIHLMVEYVLGREQADVEEPTSMLERLKSAFEGKTIDEDEEETESPAESAA